MEVTLEDLKKALDPHGLEIIEKTTTAANALGADTTKRYDTVLTF